jgi:ABC-type spermidine/putrescine transport system permease subunit I
MIGPKTGRRFQVVRARLRLQLAVFLLPPLAALIVLFVLPIAWTVVYSFWTMDNDYQIVRTASLANYRLITSEPLYLDTLLSSAWMAFLTMVFCVALALPLAWFIARRVPQRWRVLFIVGLILPGWVSVLIRTYSMNLVLGESGLINLLLTRAQLIAKPLEILFTETAVVIGLVYIYLPYTMVPIYAAIERLDDSILEAAENLGAGPVERFVRIVLPLISPGIVAGCIITFIPALGEYLVPNLLGGLQGIMFGNLIATAFQSFNWPLGSALSVVMLTSIVILLLAFFRLGERSRNLMAAEEHA